MLFFIISENINHKYNYAVVKTKLFNELDVMEIWYFFIFTDYRRYDRR